MFMACENVQTRRTPIFMACVVWLRAPSLHHVGCGDRSVVARPHAKRRDVLSRKSAWFGAGLIATALGVAALSAATGPAQAAVVYCKTAGVPQGCVVRPTVAVVPVAAATSAVG